MRRYFSLSLAADYNDKELVFLDREPLELVQHGHRLATGERMGDDYPQIVRFVMQLGRPGLRLTTLIGNSVNYLIVHKALADIVKNANCGEIEIWPMEIINHKGRCHSKDYWIINPIGTIDCMDEKASEVTRAKSTPGRLLSIEKLVLREDRLTNAPDIFRVRDHIDIIISSTLGKSLQGHGFTNIYLEEHEVTPARR
jgi:hypothetical protein